MTAVVDPIAVRVFDPLTAEYTAWLDAESLPRMSAEELVYEDLSAAQSAWLCAFVERWDNAEELYLEEVAKENPQ